MKHYTTKSDVIYFTTAGDPKPLIWDRNRQLQMLLFYDYYYNRCHHLTWTASRSGEIPFELPFSVYLNISDYFYISCQQMGLFFFFLQITLAQLGNMNHRITLVHLPVP